MPAIYDALGDSVMTWLSNVPWWLTLPILAGASVLATILAVSFCRALAIVGVAAWSRSLVLVAQLTEAIARGLFAAGDGLAALLRACLYLLTWPLAALWERTVEPAWQALAVKVEQLRQQQELKAHWRAEFRDQFATFREFLDAFENGGKARGDERQREQPKVDPSQQAFAAACRILGLPTNGEFTLQQLNARYRALMQKAHPDSGGTHEHAARLNAARGLIKTRKGWL